MTENRKVNEMGNNICWPNGDMTDMVGTDPDNDTSPGTTNRSITKVNYNNLVPIGHDNQVHMQPASSRNRKRGILKWRT